ncbi:MAG: hypothetical protein SOI66_07110 [Bifidobacterium sp.]|jgi:putative ABC transport system permease protein
MGARTHWIARLAVWVSLALTAIISFEMFTFVDQQLPAGTSTAFTISRVDSATKRRAVASITDASRDLRINVFKIQLSLHGSMNSRVLFVFMGDRRSFERNGGYSYPSFSTHRQSTTVMPSDGITTQDLRGDYATNANASQMKQHVAALSNSGIVVSTSRGFWVSTMITALGDSGLSAGMAIVVIVLIISIAYSLSSNGKIHALEALHGYTAGRIFLGELLSLLMTVCVGVAALAVTGFAFLGFFNGFHQIWRFLGLLFTALAVLTAYLIVLVLVLGGAGTFYDRIPAIIDGKSNALRDGIIAFVAQFLVMAMVFGTVGGALARISAIRRTGQSLTQWSHIADQYVLRLSLNTTHEDEVHEAAPLMEAITMLDRQGEVMVTRYSGDSVIDPAGESDSYDPEASNSIIVNPRYLNNQRVIDASGKRITIDKTDTGAFDLLVPASYRGDTAALMSRYVKYFKSECRMPDGDATSVCNPKGTLIRTRAGQNVSLFTGTQSMSAETQQRLSLNNPAIAVVSPSSGLISPLAYLSYTSNDQVLFSDPSHVQTELERRGIMQGFQGIDDAKDSIAYTMSLSRTEQLGDVMAISLGSVAFVLATLVCSAVYCERRRRMSFVRFIHGYGFLRRHGVFLVGQGATMLVALVATARIGSMTRASDLITGALLFAVSCLIMTATVTAYEFRFRADDIKRP